MKKRLTGQHQQFIIIQLARFCSPSEVAEMLQSTFGIEISRAAISHYDPTLKQSRGTLKPEWIELFNQTRADFLNELSKVPISHRAYRLMQLDRLFRQAQRARNIPLAAQLLEQAAKECGDYYVRTKSTGIVTGAPSGVVNLDDWKRLHGVMTKVG